MQAFDKSGAIDVIAAPRSDRTGMKRVSVDGTRRALEAALQGVMEI